MDSNIDPEINAVSEAIKYVKKYTANADHSSPSSSSIVNTNKNNHNSSPDSNDDMVVDTATQLLKILQYQIPSVEKINSKQEKRSFIFYEGEKNIEEVGNTNNGNNIDDQDENFNDNHASDDNNNKNNNNNIIDNNSNDDDDNNNNVNNNNNNNNNNNLEQQQQQQQQIGDSEEIIQNSKNKDDVLMMESNSHETINNNNGTAVQGGKRIVSSTSRMKFIDSPLNFVMMDPSTKDGLSKRLGRPRTSMRNRETPQQSSLNNSNDSIISRFRFENSGGPKTKTSFKNGKLPSKSKGKNRKIIQHTDGFKMVIEDPGLDISISNDDDNYNNHDQHHHIQNDKSNKKDNNIETTQILSTTEGTTEAITNSMTTTSNTTTNTATNNDNLTSDIISSSSKTEEISSPTLTTLKSTKLERQTPSTTIVIENIASLKAKGRSTAKDSFSRFRVAKIGGTRNQSDTQKVDVGSGDVKTNG